MVFVVCVLVIWGAGGRVWFGLEVGGVMLWSQVYTVERGHLLA